MTKVDRMLDKVKDAAMYVSGRDALSAYESIAWYILTRRASYEYEQAIEAASADQMRKVISQLAKRGGSTQDQARRSAKLLRVEIA